MNEILLLLSTTEAIELKNTIEQLLESDDMHHAHISNDNYQKEITVSILDKNPVETYHADIRDIIEKDNTV
jgi:hypothetical protein